jgi:hypothetical protein
VGYGTLQRPFKGAGQNVAPWIVRYQWVGRTQQDERACHQFLKRIGTHVHNDQGTEWFCLDPDTSYQDFFMMVNGFMEGQAKLRDFERGNALAASGPATTLNASAASAPSPASGASAAGLSTTHTTTAMLTPAIDELGPPSTTPCKQFRHALRDLLRTTPSGKTKISKGLQIPRTENDSTVRGVGTMLAAVCAVFGHFVRAWDGKDPYDILRQPEFERLIDESKGKEAQVFGCNGCGRGSPRQAIGWLHELQQLYDEHKFSLSVTNRSERSVDLVLTIDNHTYLYTAEFNETPMCTAHDDAEPKRRRVDFDFSEVRRLSVNESEMKD